MPDDDLTFVAPLADLVAAADYRDLLPQGFEGTSLTGSAALVDATPLAEDKFISVVRITSGELVGVPLVVDGHAVRRARPHDGVATRLLEAMTTPTAVLGGRFEIVRVRPGTFAERAVVRPMLVDQTHESVVVGDDVVVKWAVHAEPTPAPTLVAHLCEAGLTEMAQPWGFVTWSTGGQQIVLATIVGYLEEATDGWSWAVEDAGKWATGEGSLAESIAPMRDVGCLVADLHACMATPTSVIGSPMQVATGRDVRRWHDVAVSTLDDVADAVDGPEGDRLRGRSSDIRATLAHLTDVESTPTIPVHGDLHVGQILRWSGGYAIGDFDGNPVLPVRERMEPQPAARDVAGMLQSIDHVGRVVGRRVDGADDERVAEWIVVAQAEFRAAYTSAARGHGIDQLLDERLLLPFQVEQECREFLYAVRHLPRWRYVPDQALAALFP